MFASESDPEITFLRLQNAVAREMFHKPYRLLAAKNRAKADKALSEFLLTLISILPEFFEPSRREIGFKSKRST
jgi:hypothetical protein